MSQPSDKRQEDVDGFLSLSGEERVHTMISHFAEQAKDPETTARNPGLFSSEWSKHLFPHLSVHSVSAPDAPHPSVTFSFTVQPQHCNSLNNLHGGCTATLFDFCTSTCLALVSKPGFWSYLGVSRTLSTSYLRPVPAGTRVLIECDIAQIGRRLALLRGTMRRADGGREVLATCEHHKVNNDPGAAAKV